MSARPSLLKQTALKKAVLGVEQAGLHIGHVEIGNDGCIRIYPKEPAKEPPKTAPAVTELQPEPWD